MDQKIQLGKFLFVTPTRWNEKLRVDLRYWGKSEHQEELRPSTKGVHLTLEEWQTFKKAIPHIDKVFKSQQEPLLLYQPNYQEQSKKPYLYPDGGYDEPDSLVIA